MPRKVFFFLFLFCFGFGSYTQSLDEIYTNWAKENIPNSHGQIEQMVMKIWGDDESRIKPLIELHCKSLNKLLIKIQSEGPNQEALAQALTKWSEAPDNARTEKWWEWPDTNWIRVEGEYNSLLENSN